jgi:diketogulonate reductase-like aldo/keto reductase
LQQGFSVLPKSTNPIHIEENIRLDFSLDDHDLQKLSSLDLNRKYAWNPDSVV